MIITDEKMPRFIALCAKLKQQDIAEVFFEWAPHVGWFDVTVWIPRYSKVVCPCALVSIRNSKELAEMVNHLEALSDFDAQDDALRGEGEE